MFTLVLHTMPNSLTCIQSNSQPSRNMNSRIIGVSNIERGSCDPSHATFSVTFWSVLCIANFCKNKKLSWCWQTRATRLEVNQGHQTVAFHMIGIVSSCAIVTLSLRRAVFTIFDFKKCCDLEIGVRSHSRSLKVGPFDRLCMVSY